MNILFAASEAYPFMKTGGLGDVVHSLPEALIKLDNDVRLVLPGYRNIIDKVDNISVLAHWYIPGAGRVFEVRILQAHDDIIGDYLYLVDVPGLFDRPGNPYLGPDGKSWPDNAERFTVFNRTVAMMASVIPGTNWTPDIVHCHDWQTGLVPAFMKTDGLPARSVFTIHNIAYDGYYSYDDFVLLGLPPEWWSPDYIEFYGGYSMLKSGMVFSDRVTTVSPAYASEIRTPEYGCGFEGLLQHFGSKLTGILNGIDQEIWNPAKDRHISSHYNVNRHRAAGKLANKTALLESFDLEVTDAPLLGFIGRLVEQKGIDLIIETIPAIFESTDAMMIILGAGESAYEDDLRAMQQRFPDRFRVYIGYSEAIAHQIEAGCDIFMMPSRFEPCGLNQMYSLRYGTPPVVNHTGGLADTVIDTNDLTISDKTANGFVFYNAEQPAFFDAISRAIQAYRNPKLWSRICRAAMLQKHGWDTSAREYLDLYEAEINTQ